MGGGGGEMVHVSGGMGFMWEPEPFGYSHSLEFRIRKKSLHVRNNLRVKKQ